ncbi:MAG TPA: hypothetical protein DCP63_14405 [Bacteroidetes bacterium]|nr:hypothetical protein [Bacteroidota bacterium]
MAKSQNPKFYVLYSARHEQCGKRIESPDPKLSSKEALARWCHRKEKTGKLKMRELHCYDCGEDFHPSHIWIGEVDGQVVKAVVPQTKISKFDPKKWPLLPK